MLMENSLVNFSYGNAFVGLTIISTPNQNEGVGRLGRGWFLQRGGQLVFGVRESRLCTNGETKSSTYEERYKPPFQVEEPVTQCQKRTQEGPHC